MISNGTRQPFGNCPTYGSHAHNPKGMAGQSAPIKGWTPAGKPSGADEAIPGCEVAGQPD